MFYLYFCFCVPREVFICYYFVILTLFARLTFAPTMFCSFFMPCDVLVTCMSSRLLLSAFYGCRLWLSCTKSSIHAYEEPQSLKINVCYDCFIIGHAFSKHRIQVCFNSGLCTERRAHSQHRFRGRGVLSWTSTLVLSFTTERSSKHFRNIDLSSDLYLIANKHMARFRAWKRALPDPL